MTPGPALSLLDNSHWTTTFITNTNSAFTAFMAANVASPPSSFGVLSHVNISFYKGHNTAQPPWRGPGYKYPPLYRATPLVDPVESYSCKAVVGSQKRRRTSVTP